MVSYLEAYAEGLNIRLGWDVEGISKLPGGGYTLSSRGGSALKCEHLVVATGKPLPNVPEQILGIEYATPYEQAPIKESDFENQYVLILGGGNSAFEVSDVVYKSAAELAHYMQNSIRLAQETHYVGDLRAINMISAENYQVKVGTLMTVVNFQDAQIVPLPSGKLWYLVRKGPTRLAATYRDRLKMPLNDTFLRQVLERLGEEPHGVAADTWVKDMHTTLELTDYPYYRLDSSSRAFHNRHAYDRIIHCTGFRMDTSPFTDTVPDLVGNLPHTTPWFESVNNPGMFFVGALMHGRDYRKSSGGFIHGFRYLTRVVFRHLESTVFGTPWPSEVLSADPRDVAVHLLTRLSTSSALFQMFGVLSDVYSLTCHGVRYYPEVPRDALGSFPWGDDATGVLVVATLEFNPDFSVAGGDVFNFEKRTGPFVSKQFLHPVLRVFKKPPPPGEWDTSQLVGEMHLIEDGFNEFLVEEAYVVPVLRLFQNLAYVLASNGTACFANFLRHANIPPPSVQAIRETGDASQATLKEIRQVRERAWTRATAEKLKRMEQQAQNRASRDEIAAWKAARALEGTTSQPVESGGTRRECRLIGFDGTCRK